MTAHRPEKARYDYDGTRPSNPGPVNPGPADTRPFTLMETIGGVLILLGGLALLLVVAVQSWRLFTVEPVAFIVGAVLGALVTYFTCRAKKSAD